MASLERNLANRGWLLERLHAEVVGPDPPIGQNTVISGPVECRFQSWEEFRKPKVQPDGQEILWQDAPVKRYGAGILFPAEITEAAHLAAAAGTQPLEEAEADTANESELPFEESGGGEKRGQPGAVDDTEDLDVTLANAYRPSAMGLSFLVDLSTERQGLIVEVSAARYRRVVARIANSGGKSDSERDLWFRTPTVTARGGTPTIVIPTEQLAGDRRRLEFEVPSDGQHRLRLVVVSRPDPAGNDTLRLVTACLVNRQGRGIGRLDELCYFQCGLRVAGGSSGGAIVAYPENDLQSRDPADERQVARLLYRDRQTFAIGHGCAARWELVKPEGTWPQRASAIWTESLPVFETRATSADLRDSSGASLAVSMRKLAGLDPTDDGFSEVRRLLAAYQEWISQLEELEYVRPVIPNIPRPPIAADLRPTAQLLLSRCRLCQSRIAAGLGFLIGEDRRSTLARRAFQLANEAMLIAQLRSSRDVRTPAWDAASGRITWDRPVPTHDASIPDPSRGYWRPFQIAFLLMSIPGICDPEHADRQLVDLIWFPTGGGKTEAYLGLTAFTLLYNRLLGRDPGGVDVIMRYTLRLLTAQQFQRAALLFCAIEDTRRRHREELGEKEFRLGLWVGGDATPNDRAGALRSLRRLEGDPQHAENPFVLLKCPWCNARFGPVSDQRDDLRRRRPGRGRPPGGSSPKSVYGYMARPLPGRRAETVVFQCEDPDCPFSRHPLPISVIDEELYDSPPSLLIATVDKFAMLAWKLGIRRLFGIAEDATRTGFPPTLIIQDELHLISGPLGSMVGAYETVIDDLCTGPSPAHGFERPKIVASTATISHAAEQIRALFARPHVALFPPSGLEAGDSFFARDARDESGALSPGRLYAGVMAPGHGSQQTTQARVFATLLQFPAVMEVEAGDESERDPWWTLVCFFNSLRELGGAATLLVADARDYLRVLLDRHGFGYGRIRQLLNWEELTSRVRSDQVPAAIQRLEIPFRRDARGGVRDTVEACLASTIIEVGVDIDRLSLMVIAGQPKTTAQYIQVSSRIGRRQESPGLVVVVYSQTKPRDRSHYERFRSYHQRLYAQVEPTSVTPFSPPAVERSLHGLLVARVRQAEPVATATSPRPCPVVPGSPTRTALQRLVSERVRIVDPTELEHVLGQLDRRLAEWQSWDPETYGGFGAQPSGAPLIYPAGTPARIEWKGRGWPTLTSLRDVDATCEAEITLYFNTLQTADQEP